MRRAIDKLLKLILNSIAAGSYVKQPCRWTHRRRRRWRRLDSAVESPSRLDTAAVGRWGLAQLHNIQYTRLGIEWGTQISIKLLNTLFNLYYLVLYYLNITRDHSSNPRSQFTQLFNKLIILFHSNSDKRLQTLIVLNSLTAKPHLFPQYGPSSTRKHLFYLCRHR